MTKPRILVVENDAVVAQRIQVQLAGLGYEPVGTAMQGEQSIELAGQLLPNLVLMDVDLAGPMDGIAAARVIRARFFLPVVFLTAFVDAETIARAKLSEPFGFILKPFSERELHAVLELALYKHEAEARFRLSDLCLKAISQGVMIAGPDYCLVTVNEAFEAMSGYLTAEVLGRKCGFLQGPLTDPLAVAAIGEALRTSTVFAGEILNYRKDGTVFWNDLSISPVRGAGGGVTHFIGITRDVTERKRSETALRESTRQLQATSQRVLEAQETERRRVARELHDELGQALTAIKINLQANERFQSQSPKELNAENIRIVEDALQQVRRLALALRPSMLDDLGLIPALRWIAEQTATRSGFAVNFHSAMPQGRLPSAVETACFRIVQEALTNIARHSRASNVEVDLYCEDDALSLSVLDDGCGFDVAAARARAVSGGSIGLLGMQERATLIGGKLEIHSTQEQGSTLLLRCPLRRRGEAP